MEVDSRLLELTRKEKELKVYEEEFRTALKGYKLDEFLIILAEISGKLYDQDFVSNDIWKKEKIGCIIHIPSKQFITDFAIEYIANILLISGSNNFKSESIRNKDNLVSTFSIYHNSIVHPLAKVNSASSLLVPMFYQQITSQQDIKHTFVRQWLIFQKSNELVDEKKIDLDSILLEKTGMTVIEYVKLCFLILAAILTKTRFNFGTFERSTIKGMDDVLNTKKISAIMKQLAITKKDFIELDKKYNSKLKPEYTKSRYNPLWEKPVIILGENDYIVPSTSAYVKGALRGLYWIFENLIGQIFRTYFGTLFENYCGMVIKDIFGEENVRPAIKFGKDNKEFFDWIVNDKNEILLFETKGYQFPLKTLQTGDAELIRKEVFSKLVETIKQTYNRCQDIQNYEELKEFRDKKITVVAVFYDIPLVSTNLYDLDIKAALIGLDAVYPGIKNFKYVFLSIEELENYYYVKDCISIEGLVNRVRNTPGSGVLDQTSQVFKENNLSNEQRVCLLDRKFKDFYEIELGIPYSENDKP